MASELLRRIGGLDGAKLSQDANIGGQVILRGNFFGTRPRQAAEFLEAEISKLSD
jgi:hypothetical protein